jgi:hypothetical protein
MKMNVFKNSFKNMNKSYIFLNISTIIKVKTHYTEQIY